MLESLPATARHLAHGPRRLALLIALAVAAGSAPAAAQQLVYPVGLQIGAGAVVPLGDAGESAGLGWDLVVAGDVEFRPGFAVRLDYLYGRFGAEEREVRAGTISRLPLPTATLSGKLQMHVGSLDLLWRRQSPGAAAAFYVFGGPVLAYRRVTLTSLGSDLGEAFNEVGVEVCEPQWFQCADTGLRYHMTLGVRRSTDPGVNVGAGVTLDIGLNARVFGEARYVYLDGPSFRDTRGASRSARAAYLPVTAGLRFQW